MTKRYCTFTLGRCYISSYIVSMDTALRTSVIKKLMLLNVQLKLVNQI